MPKGGLLALSRGAVLGGMLILGACGGSGGGTAPVDPPPPPVSVTLVNAPTQVDCGSTVSLTAQVRGTGNAALTWTVDGILNGSAAVGSLAASGDSATYTAPGIPGSHVLAAISAADPAKSASATVKVLAPAAVSVSLTPAGPLTLEVSGSVSLTAAVAGTDNTAVLWTVDGIPGGSTAAGTLSGSGNRVTYTAPATAGTHTATATSVADASKSATITLILRVPASPPGIVVAPDGVVGNPGTLASPTTLEGARALLQSASRINPGPLRVLLRGGLYPRVTAFTLGAGDSGSVANPIVYAAYPNETPRLVGGVQVSPASVRLVDASDPNWSRLDPAARSQIYVVDLAAYKAALGTLASRSDAGGQVNQAMEVFVDGVPLTLARYPKAVDRDSVNLAPAGSIQVSGALSPDVTGTYAYMGLDGQGRPYYQLSKAGTLWSIAASATGPGWQLSDRKDLGGTGSSGVWGAWDAFAGPAGAFVGRSGATGTAFLAPADGSSPVPGFMLIQGTDGTTRITTTAPRMSRWSAAEAMYFGLGYYSWSGSHSPVASLDPASGAITLSTAPGYGLRVGQPFFIYNLLEELTAPGECFIDRVNARLYLRPWGDAAPAEILLSTLQSPLLQMTDCQQVTWQGMAFEAAKNHLVSVTNGQAVAFARCQFKNAGGYGLLLGGSSNLVEACDFRQLGQGGVSVSGGSRATLTPSGTLVENCNIQQFGRLFWTYKPGIHIDANSMGITAQHNEIHHSPHAAILFGGNGHTLCYNHIHDVLQWSNDAGAIYTTGRDWGMQGNQVQFNLIRHCGSPLGTYLPGIYIDGVGSGVKVEGNILYFASPQFAIQHNGGREVEMRYNISYGQWYGVDISNVAFEVVNHTAGSTWDLLGKLLALNYQSPPWSTTYPNVAKIPNDWAQIQGSHWLEPEGSALYGNLQYGNGASVYVQHNSFTSLAPPLSWFAEAGSNLNQVDPRFVDPANLNFSLQPGSPMFSIPGFPGIDAAKIGIQH
ncbi:MAG: right-handed parallel beta-helix repeat-containing protein [Acidobacteria bacterium]|nr:right-handed parallel beta-helix repeat-containing protein [Acidobacteriota bacterium]MBI3488377.1 right-handed parallel beta-helix repeat-containing protein [Acidobacteriota bacterium]